MAGQHLLNATSTAEKTKSKSGFRSGILPIKSKALPVQSNIKDMKLAVMQSIPALQ